jgi:hypothetical protein
VDGSRPKVEARRSSFERGGDEVAFKYFAKGAGAILKFFSYGFSHRPNGDLFSVGFTHKKRETRLAGYLSGDVEKSAIIKEIPDMTSFMSMSYSWKIFLI